MKIEDIKNVKGIGDVKFEAMKDQITVGDVSQGLSEEITESVDAEQEANQIISGCSDDQISINAAPKEDLLQIKHIGESRAKELTQLRPFSSLDDLSRIKGISDGRVKDIKEQGLVCIE